MKQFLLALIEQLVIAMGTLLTPEGVKKVLDMAFDAAENKVKASSNKWDDILVLPTLAKLRAALDVPDNDPVVEGPAVEEPTVGPGPETPIV